MIRDYFNPIYKQQEQYWMWDGYLIVALAKNQLELPLVSVRPIFLQIEVNLRSKDPLKKRFPSWEETFLGERVMFQRGMSLGGDWVPGYTVFNLDRRSFIAKRLAQSRDFLDEVLLKDGLLDFMLTIEPN